MWSAVSELRRPLVAPTVTPTLLPLTCACGLLFQNSGVLWWLRQSSPHYSYQQVATMPDNESFEKGPLDLEAPSDVKSATKDLMSEKPPPDELPPAVDSAAMQPPLKSPPCCLHKHAGLLYAASSALFLSLCSVLVKLLDRFEPAELAAFRFLGIFLPSVVNSVRAGYHLFPAGHRRLLLLRALLGTTSLICKFYALRSMSLADASVILLSVPVFVAVFARIFLREPCGWLHAVTVAVTLAGMLLITRPPALFGAAAVAATGSELLGSALAFTSTLFGANVYVTMRLLKEVPATVIMTIFSAVAAPLSLCVCLVAGELQAPNTLEEGALLVALAACSFLGQLCLTRACHAEQASLVAVIRTVIEVVFAVLWQYILFGEVPTVMTIAGMLLITLSVVLVGLKKWAASLPDDSKAKLSMGCLA